MHNQKKDNNKFKNKNNQNCQIFKIHGSLTTKELKKHSSGLVRVTKMGNLYIAKEVAGELVGPTFVGR